MKIPPNAQAPELATLHYAEQVWNATAALNDAYRVDTGKGREVALWEGLTTAQQMTFILMMANHFPAIGSVVATIGAVR